MAQFMLIHTNKNALSLHKKKFHLSQFVCSSLLERTGIMKIKKITSLTALSTFVLLVVTGIVLYIVPHGRVAYWADWHLWGLNKSEWCNIHINLALLFLLTISLHIYYNWKQIVSYLKDKAKQLKIFTWEFNMALVLSFGFVAGTYFEIPPFCCIIELNASIKDSAAKKYGEPPYGHAELSSLNTLTSRMRLDLEKSMAQLKKAGVRVESGKQTIQEIAEQNNLSAQQVYLAMKPNEEQNETKSLPNKPRTGLGK
jgi:hypothetical protein